MIRTIIQAYPGYPIDDLMNTDIKTIYRVFFDEKKVEKQKQKVVSLEDFVKSVK